jgi:hypothetical protein
MQTNLHGLMTDEAVTRLAFDDPNELPRVGRRRLPQILRDRRRGTEGRRNGEDGESAGGELHSALANVTLALAILHVLGVSLASLVHRENLVLAMIDGRKRARSTEATPSKEDPSKTKTA